MSTRIYQAVRVPSSKLNEYLLACRAATLEEFFKDAERHMQLLNAQAVETEARRMMVSWKKEETDLPCLTRIAQCDMLIELYKKSSTRYEKSLFDAEASLSVWLDGKFAYLIPYGNAIFSKFPYVQDYHYQDQIDKPANVTAREWTQRKELWERIAISDWNATRLDYAIVDFVPNRAIPSMMALQRHLGLIS